MPAGREWTTTASPGITSALMLQLEAGVLQFTMPVSFHAHAQLYCHVMKVMPWLYVEVFGQCMAI